MRAGRGDPWADRVLVELADAHVRLLRGIAAAEKRADGSSLAKMEALVDGVERELRIRARSVAPGARLDLAYDVFAGGRPVALLPASGERKAAPVLSEYGHAMAESAPSGQLSLVM